ncbi:hypothetical protein [Xenorhabdus griffiniae]|uniref:hypothetical protein n=1 Tax=Xenorhabdus griffiniae TaxID=351672 RepID=UPI0023599E53|nr:hypothetical protein [Xenorhabdus griffiniae]MDC9605530.1 hypothetical protein [Xenorhabdus griffiniae]
MGKRKNKSRNGPRHAQIRSRTTVENVVRKPLHKRISNCLLWLATIGILPIIGSFTLGLLTGDVQIKSIKPSGRGYEFTLINNNSTDQIIEKFRISPDFEQDFIFNINQSIYAEFTENGVRIPGGNSTYMPAYEYKDMNGYVLPAKTEVKFRIPPLVARNYMTPKSMIVFADYSTKSNNIYLRRLEYIFSALKFRDTNKKPKYLVTDNYWTPLSHGNKVNAIKNACRDDDIFAKSVTCKKYLKD